MELTLEVLAFLTSVAFLAGAIDALAGGGGLLTIPALLTAGIPPVSALATNKLQACIGTGSSVFTYVKAGKIDLKAFALPVIGAFVGSLLGAVTLQHIDPSFLAAIVPILLVGMGLYYLLSPSMQEGDRQARFGPLGMGCVALGIGFYDGFFGPGTGSFFMTALVTLGGLSLLKAIAHTKLLNFTTNVAALLAMMVGGKVLWTLGLCMAVANVLGNQVGTWFALRFNGKGVRSLLVVVSLAMTAKLLADPENPIWSWF